jgi:hypothetical protein
MYRALEPDKIVATLETLERRVSERFPGSGLSRVAGELGAVARAGADHAAKLAKPFVWLRALSAATLALGAAAQIALIRSIRLQAASVNVIDLAQGLDATVNLLALMGAAIWFLITIEVRLKRYSALEALHELRSLAHVIDMHQLTKDPTIVLAAHRKTAASPARAMSEFELARYLDYCAEMLSLTGKVAALYAGRARDSVVIEAVNDIENLTANLGRKIWQKIMIIAQLDEARAPRAHD